MILTKQDVIICPEKISRPLHFPEELRLLRSGTRQGLVDFSVVEHVKRFD